MLETPARLGESDLTASPLEPPAQPASMSRQRWPHVPKFNPRRDALKCAFSN
jgi:hypothetical protein